MPARTFIPWCRVASLGRPSGSRLFQASKVPADGWMILSIFLNRVAPPRRHVVQADHGGPGALTRFGAMDEIVGPAGVEEVGVEPELLPHTIALSLERLAIFGRNAEKSADVRFHGGDAMIRTVEVAGLARPEVGNAEIVGDSGRAATRVDQADEVPADLRRQKTRHDEQFDLPGRNSPNPWLRRQSSG